MSEDGDASPLSELRARVIDTTLIEAARRLSHSTTTAPAERDDAAHRLRRIRIEGRQR